MKKKILIVEDEPIIAMVYRKSLEREGFEVTGMASSGEDAIVSAEIVPPDIILMDIILSGPMDGIEAAESICKRSRIPHVYLTGNNDVNTKKRAMKTEPLDFLVKPVDITFLCRIIHQLPAD